MTMSNSCSEKPTYDIDPASLERRYKLSQWHLHPDKTVNRTHEEQDFSATQASLINQAYGVLRNPLARANYMVSNRQCVYLDKGYKMRETSLRF
jgi:molecular chaperone HscB